MREFFRGWRRKIGVVTLMVASVVAVGWVRSLSENDIVFLGGRLIIVSASGKFGISKEVQFNYPQKNPAWTAEYIITANSFPDELFHLHRFPATQETFKTDTHMIPYWSITVPLTLISLWLLLAKPRKSTLKKPANPTEDKGAATS